MHFIFHSTTFKTKNLQLLMLHYAAYVWSILAARAVYSHL